MSACHHLLTLCYLFYANRPVFSRIWTILTSKQAYAIYDFRCDFNDIKVVDLDLKTGKAVIEISRDKISVLDSDFGKVKFPTDSKKEKKWHCSG